MGDGTHELMISHHFVGTGTASGLLNRAARDPEALLAGIARAVGDTGLEVVSRLAVPFDNGGLTLVWVLAESHLVLHFWPEEGSATVDLHVCDYRRSNAGRAGDLVAHLNALLFVAGSDRWQELEVGRPAPVPLGAVD